MNVNIYFCMLRNTYQKNIGANLGYITLQIVCGRGSLSVLHE